MASPRTIRASVTRIVDHGDRVYTVELATERRTPSFRPGQFLHLTIDEYDATSYWPESRVFSIASSSEDRNRLRICYSVIGAYTTRMERELREGANVWIKLPYGDFVVDLKRETILLAGGTGFSAFSAFMESVTASAHPLHILYGARNERLLVFADLVREKCREFEMINAVFFCQQADAGARKTEVTNRGVRVEAGIIDLDAVWSQINDPRDVDCYIAGPPAMMEAMGAELLRRNVPASSILRDAW